MKYNQKYKLCEELIKIDHHINRSPYGDLMWVEEERSSACEMIAAFYGAFQDQLKITGRAATCIFTGMVTDSGRFRYDSTSAQTFRMASFLMEQPFDTNEIYKNLYANDFEQMRLRAFFTLKIQFTDPPCGGVAYIYTTLQEVKDSGADIFTVSRGMVSTMSDIRGIDIWVNFTETEKGVICEIRSSKYNINPIAVKYGGGGHAKASGATVADYNAAMQMLADLRAMIKEDA